MKIWQELECPITGNDLDLDRLYHAGELITCCWCGGYHACCDDVVQTYVEDEAGRLETLVIPTTAVAAQDLVRLCTG